MQEVTGSPKLMGKYVRNLKLEGTTTKVSFYVINKLFIIPFDRKLDADFLLKHSIITNWEALKLQLRINSTALDKEIFVERLHENQVEI